MARSYRKCIGWLKAVEFRNFVYEFVGRLKFEDSHIFIDMRNSVDILVFGFMMAYEYMDEQSVLACLDNSRGKVGRLMSIFSPVTVGKYLTEMEIQEIRVQLNGIMFWIDKMVRDVESGKFFKEDEKDVFDELDGL